MLNTNYYSFISEVCSAQTDDKTIFDNFDFLFTNYYTFASECTMFNSFWVLRVLIAYTTACLITPLGGWVG